MNWQVAKQKRQVLVTGATGFLGRRLVAALLSEGCEVLALVHKRSLPEHLRTSSVNVIQGDLNDIATFRDITLQVDAVCHLAAYIPPNYEDPAYAEICLKTNGLSTLQLAQLALGRPELRFVYLSTGNTYAFTSDAVTETNSLYPADRATYYLSSKMIGEIFVDHLRRAHQLHAVCLRASSIYGQGMPSKSVLSNFMNNASQGLPLEVWGDGIPTCDYVYIDDVVGAAISALDVCDPGVYNVGSGRLHSVLELAKAVADTFPEQQVSIELKPSIDSSHVGFPALAIDKARQAWNYSPLSLREGLAQYRKQMERWKNDCNNF